MENQNYKHPMTKLIFLLIICGSFYLAPAQDLTKEETVNYINKKLNETAGRYLTIKDEKGVIEPVYYYSSVLELNDNKITYTKNWGTERNKRNSKMVAPCGYKEVKEVITFSLDKILNIELYDPQENVNAPLGVIRITMSQNTMNLDGTIWGEAEVKVDDNYARDCIFAPLPVVGFTKWTLLPYLKGDGSDGNKIKKALEYLRDLAKAEDDPFGN